MLLKGSSTGKMKVKQNSSCYSQPWGKEEAQEENVKDQENGLYHVYEKGKTLEGMVQYDTTTITTIITNNNRPLMLT